MRVSLFMLAEVNDWAEQIVILFFDFGLKGIEIFKFYISPYLLLTKVA